MKTFGGTLAVLAFSVVVMFAWVGAAAAQTISNCGKTISKRGTYYLTRNISTLTGTCLIVEADDITIDLKGFEIRGRGGIGSGTIGVSATKHARTVVRNGIIADFDTGILILGKDPLVDRVILYGNGFAVRLDRGQVKNSTIHNNNGGISFTRSGSVTNNTFYNNRNPQVQGSGLTVTVSGNTIAKTIVNYPADPVITANVVKDNILLDVDAGQAMIIAARPPGMIVGNRVIDSTGLFAIFVGEWSGVIDPNNTVTDNVVNDNVVQYAGIRSNGGQVLRNTALRNSTIGIMAVCPSTVKFNTALHNGYVDFRDRSIPPAPSPCVKAGNNFVTELSP